MCTHTPISKCTKSKASTLQQIFKSQYMEITVKTRSSTQNKHKDGNKRYTACENYSQHTTQVARTWKPGMERTKGKLVHHYSMCCDRDRVTSRSRVLHN